MDGWMDGRTDTKFNYVFDLCRKSEKRKNIKASTNHDVNMH